MQTAARKQLNNQNKHLHLFPGPASKQSEQTDASSSVDRASPGRVGAIFVKVVSDNRIDLKWTGVKGPDFNHYNIYMYTNPSFKISPGVTVPIGTSDTNSYSSTSLNALPRIITR